jgi:hypothetical protein
MIEREARGVRESESMVKRSAILLGGSAIVWLAILEWNPVYDTDVFWQIELGREMLATGRLATTDTLTYTHAGERVPAVGWLAQVAFAGLYEAGGWRLVRLAHHGIWITAVVLMGRLAIRCGAGPLGAAFACWCAFPVLLHAVHVRPQGLSALGLAVVLSIADRSRVGWRGILAGGMAGVMWQNAHPSVLVGAVSVGALAAGRVWARWKGGEQVWPWGQVVLAGGLALAQGATPEGWGMFEVSRVNLEIARDVLRVREWLPPWDGAVAGVMLPFWLALGVTEALCWTWRRELKADWVCVVAVLTGLVGLACRFAMYWGLGVIPLWAAWATRHFPGWSAVLWRDEGMTRATRGWGAAAFGLGVTGVVLLHPGGRGVILHQDLPVAGIARLRAVLPGPARIYNAYEWAGPILLERPTGWRVAVDGRLYCEGKTAVWAWREGVSSGRIALAELEEREQCDALVLGAGDSGLIRAARDSRQWHELYEGPTCVIFTRQLAGTTLAAGRAEAGRQAGGVE